MVHVVICQMWLESEQGWGQRPDGCSLHMNEADRLAFEKEYWQSGAHTPKEYSMHTGKPFEVEVSEELFEKVRASNNGIRLWQHQITQISKGTLTIKQ